MYCLYFRDNFGKCELITARCYAERGYATLSRPSVCLSVRLWRSCSLRWSHRLEYFENNFTADQLKVLARLTIGDLVQWEHPKILVE